MDPHPILNSALDAITVRRVFGDPLPADGVTIIPAAIVGGGGGGGGGRGPNADVGGAGAGFGLRGRPAGAFVVRHGDVTWRPAIDVNRVILGGQIVAITALIVLGPILRQWLRGRTAPPLTLGE